MTEPSDLDPADYKLTDTQLQECFDTKIRASLEGPSHATPTVVCITGPMASGKTTTMSAAPAMFNIPDACQIDSDEYAAAHPAYLPLREQYGETVARKMTGHVTSPLWQKAVDYVHQHRRNAVISGPMSDPQWFADKFTPLRDDGIRVTVVSVAVHPARSLLSAVDRFHQREATTGNGVWFAPAWHDRHYPATRDTIHAIERDGLADELHIAERGGRIVYSNRLLDRDPVQWQSEPRGVEALDAARSQPWTDQDHARHHDRAIVLMNSPLLDSEKRLVVADAINRSFEPNDRAVAALEADAQALQHATARGAGPAMAALPDDASANAHAAAEQTDRATVDQLRQRIEQRDGYSTNLKAAVHQWAAAAPPWSERPYGTAPDEQLGELFATAEQRRTAAVDQATALREPAGSGPTDSSPASTHLEAEADAVRLDGQANDFAADAEAIHGEQVIRASLPPERAAAERAERRSQPIQHHQPGVDPEAAEAIALLAEQQGASAGRAGSPSAGRTPDSSPASRPAPHRPHGQSPNSAPER